MSETSLKSAINPFIPCAALIAVSYQIILQLNLQGVVRPLLVLCGFNTRG